MNPSLSSLEIFSPPVRDWFRERFSQTTGIQDLAWPRIAAGKHVLITAPTGSGKTLTAFLWAIDQLIRGEWAQGQLQVLYISPLRALGNDIHRNLLMPLHELPAHCARHGMTMPNLEVNIRTGDTDQRTRRRILKRPPEILITTPESLNIMLTSASGRQLLSGLRSVILDEVHAVAGSKRGVHLISGVERLVPLCGEFQRIALSATVRPPERIARWIGGYQLNSRNGTYHHQERNVEIINSKELKKYEFRVRLAATVNEVDRHSLWSSFAARLKEKIHGNHSTLVFGNSRRMVEKVARLINENEDEQLAYSHHGSLSREIRSIVEERMKRGELKAIVATNSLELGIDVGFIDEVLLIQPPPSIASAVQRLGRSGHSVGATSRGRLYAIHGRGLIAAAVIAKSVTEGEIEEITPISGALDVLAQVLLSMVCAEVWRIDDLFEAIRCATPYHELKRGHFDLVLEMLKGSYADTRLRTLRPLISIDQIDQTVRARPGSERLIYLSGGTIADRGYFQLRLHGSGTRIGELDEEFVWERSPGDTFTLGVQTWRVESISFNDVTVSPANAASAMAPFWRSEEQDRSYFLSEKIGIFLEWCSQTLGKKHFVRDLQRLYHLERQAAEELRRQLQEQVAATGILPHRHLIVQESIRSVSGRGRERQLILMTMWGGTVNRPLAAALGEAWHRRYGQRPSIVHDDDCIVISYPSTLEVNDPFDLVRPENIEELVHSSLERTGFFGARFREAAGCALLLPRAGYKKRTPLWVNRKRSKELLEAVSGTGDFPIVLEAWRACLHDELDIEALIKLLYEVQETQIRIAKVHTDKPSPFAAHVLWKQTNDLMYDDDTPARGATGLGRELISEVALSPQLRPAIAENIVHDLEAKLKRCYPGYAPRTAGDLLHWVKERLFLPESEWHALIAAMKRDHDVDLDQIIDEIEQRIVLVDGVSPGIIAIETVPRWAEAFKINDVSILFCALDHSRPIPEAAQNALETVMACERPMSEGSDLANFLGEWLRFYGPVTVEKIQRTFGAEATNVDPADIEAAVAELASEYLVAVDVMISGRVNLAICDRENLERLLRLTRTQARPQFTPKPVDYLPLLLACYQHLGAADCSPDDLENALESLFFFPGAAGLWESEYLPARIEPYMGQWLDALLTDTDLRWVGCGEKRLFFAFDSDRELIGIPEESIPVDDVFPDGYARYPLHELMRATGETSAVLSDRLWSLAWQGRASSDSFSTIRSGLEENFRQSVALEASAVSRRRRSSFDRWRSQRAFAGSWFRLPVPPPPGDALDSEELDKDRARLIIDRYGLVFRRLLKRETSAFQFSKLFRAFRLLELSGEIVGGTFIRGIDGLQFASHQALRMLEDLPEDRIWWMNASDPASPCGLGLKDLPKRLTSNHLVFHGRHLAVVSERNGAKLSIRVDPDHPHLEAYFSFLKNMLTRASGPLKHITIETINDENAGASPFRNALGTVFHATKKNKALRISRKY